MQNNLIQRPRAKYWVERIQHVKLHDIHFPASILLGISLAAHVLNGDWFAALWCAVAWVLLVLHYQAISERDLYREILSKSLSKAKAAPETKVDTPAASSSAPHAAPRANLKGGHQ